MSEYDPADEEPAPDEAANDDPTRYSESECFNFIRSLFPRGVAGNDVTGELAPDGWENSPLAAVFHPSPERQYEESLRMHENL